MPTVTSTIEVGSNPEQVWSLISDGTRMVEWLAPVKALEGEAPSTLVPGTQFNAVLGRLSGAKIKITEAVLNRRLAWRAGPPVAHMMGMPMSASVDLAASEGGTRVTFTIKSAMMMVPLMKMMSGLRFKEEVPKTALSIKRVLEDERARIHKTEQPESEEGQVEPIRGIIRRAMGPY